MHKTDPRRIVITGASSGIGAATAEAFAAQGAQLVLASRNRAALEQVAIRCRAAGATVHIIPTDVTDAEAVAQLATSAQALMGGIDLWLSNVGIGVIGRLQDVPAAAHRQVIEANLIGHLNDAHAVLPIFIEQGHGIFVNMISAGAFVGTSWAPAYSASKFGLRGLSQALRAEVASYPDIHICDVYPTFVDTPAIRHAGNYSGGRTTVPPGVLDPRKVARAILRLADHPRNTTAVGMPAALMQLAQFAAPHLSARVTSGMMTRHFQKADPAPLTNGNLFTPPADDGEIDGGFREPEKRAGVGRGLGVAGIAAAMLGGYLVLRRRRQPDV